MYFHVLEYVGIVGSGVDFQYIKPNSFCKVLVVAIYIPTSKAGFLYILAHTGSCVNVT